MQVFQKSVGRAEKCPIARSRKLLSGSFEGGLAPLMPEESFNRCLYTP